MTSVCTEVGTEQESSYCIHIHEHVNDADLLLSFGSLYPASVISLVW